MQLCKVAIIKKERLMVRKLRAFLTRLTRVINPVAVAAVLFNFKISSMQKLHEESLKRHTLNAVDTPPKPSGEIENN